LWRWAVEQLDDRIMVLPQVLLTVPDRGRPQEAEIDLVLLDPEHGVTVVEVKGGRMHYDGAGRWMQNGRECRDPVQQVKRARSILRRLLDEQGVDVDRVALRWVVATPECELQPPGGAILDRTQLWDARAIEGLAERYRLATGALATGEEPLGRQVDRLVTLLRGRAVEGRPSIASAIDRHEASVRVFGESHRNVLHQITTNPHVLVTGAAGTGKTLLGIEAAVRYASMGERVLFACWNVALGRWLIEAVRARLEELSSPLAAEVTDQPTGRIVVADLGSLALQGRSVSEAVREHAEDRGEYFYRQLPYDLTPAVTDGEFDVVVLDEAQDLSEDWVLALSALVARDGRWFAFSDPTQNLFAADAALPDFLEVHHELRENFRNTPEIADFVDDFGPIEIDCVSTSGEPVRFVSAEGDVVGEARREVERLQRNGVDAKEIALLHLYTNPHQHRPSDLVDAVFSDGVVETNGASFKGMERPVVVLSLDIDPERRGADEVARGIYTTASRARALLVVVGDPAALRQIGMDDLAARFG
jgi:hypothetical protein